MCQVLEGLLYLHDQGVIHRDIKGSNILATKEGSVKLADFGVATRGGGSDRSVVGSPYWMAPEVVEQSGATTASDIWSVGCTVIELLEGQPPYHELDPMPALFRIVNDDCPPLPDGASPVVRDFLLQCFQKDSNLRVSAWKLLKHPWMVSARKQLDQMKGRSNTSRKSTSTYEETIARVQEWNQALDKPSNSLAHPLSLVNPTSRLSQDAAKALQAYSHKDTKTIKAVQNAFAEMKLDTNERATRRRTVPAATSRLQVNHEDDKENDNWDDDFTEDIPREKMAALDGSATLDASSDDMPDNCDTIRPGRDGSRALELTRVGVINGLDHSKGSVSNDSREPLFGRFTSLEVRRR